MCSQGQGCKDLYREKSRLQWIEGFQYTEGSFKHWQMASFGKQIFTVAVLMFIQIEKTDNELKKSTHQS